jgi:hypothetical protein
VDAALLPNTPAIRALVAADAPKMATEKAPSQAATTAGRKLLQGGGRGGGGGSRTRGAANNQWAAMNTQAAIKRAATGRVPASYGTSTGTRSARAAAANCVNCLSWDRRW